MLAGHRTCFKVTQLHVSGEAGGQRPNRFTTFWVLATRHWPGQAKGRLVGWSVGLVGLRSPSSTAQVSRPLEYIITCLLLSAAGKSMRRRTDNAAVSVSWG